MNEKQIKQKLLYLVGSFFVNCCGKEKKSQEILKSLHNKYMGKRCFIIGNGPSLTPEDLDKLKGEITFASNRIYTIFNKTEWRPSYYGIIDESVSRTPGLIQEVSNMKCIKFLRKEGFLYYKDIKGDTCYIHSWWDRKYLDNPQFSEDLTQGIYTIATVTYALIEIAYWMGFSEIYLLGMDNRYKFGMTRDGRVFRNKGVCNYFGEDVKDEPLPQTAPATWEMDVAYEYAEKFSREHGFRIYNATRGGFLEKFERVDLDEVLERPGN